MRLFSRLALGALLAITQTAHADILAGYDDGILGTNQTTGQAFTVSGTGSYTNIRFNFFGSDKITPEAPGTGYLLSQEYLGTVPNLNSSTPGYVASAVGSGGFYDFGSTTLTAGDTYYLYDTSGVVAGIGEALNGQISFGYSGPGFYVNIDGGINVGTNFQVTGDAVISPTGTPEPASIGLLGAGLVGIGAIRRRRR